MILMGKEESASFFGWSTSKGNPSPKCATNWATGLSPKLARRSSLLRQEAPEVLQYLTVELLPAFQSRAASCSIAASERNRETLAQPNPTTGLLRKIQRMVGASVFESLLLNACSGESKGQPTFYTPMCKQKV